MSSAQFSSPLRPPPQRRGSALFTLGMIGVLVAIEAYLTLVAAPGDANALFKRFALEPLRFASGDYSAENIITLFSYAMLHANWQHLAFNAFGLITFGLIVERLLGSFRTALVYVVSAAGSAMFYMALNLHEPVQLVGASGAISGIFGAAIPLTPPALRRSMYANAAIWLGLNVFLPWLQQQAGGNIAWDAHLGGFIVGLGMGWLMRSSNATRGPWPRADRAVDDGSGRGSQTGDRNNPGKTTIAQPTQPKKQGGPIDRR